MLPSSRLQQDIMGILHHDFMVCDAVVVCQFWSLEFRSWICDVTRCHTHQSFNKQKGRIAWFPSCHVCISNVVNSWYNSCKFNGVSLLSCYFTTPIWTQIPFKKSVAHTLLQESSKNPAGCTHGETTHGPGEWWTSIIVVYLRPPGLRLAIRR